MKKVFLLLITISLFAFVMNKEKISYKFHIYQIKNEMDQIVQTLNVGTSNRYLSKEKFKEYGFGSCEQFTKLLQEELGKIGFLSRIVGAISKTGDAHNMLEIMVNKHWILADPMNNIMYENSFLEILSNPDLSNIKIIDNLTPVSPILVKSEFFENAAGILLGDMYFGDNYRFFPINFKENKSSTFTCPTEKCDWEVDIPDNFLNDKMYSEFHLVEFLSADQSLRFNFKAQRIPNSTKFLPWVITPKNDKIHFTTMSQNAHSFQINLIRSPIDNFTTIKMYSPISSVLLFRGSSIDFFGSNLTCDKEIIWEKKVTLDEERFYNGFFLPSDQSIPAAWTAVKVRNNKNYRSSVIELPSNEPRIRIQPEFQKNPKVCTLKIEYTAKEPSKALLFSEKTSELIELGSLEICKKNKICEFSYHFNPNDLNMIF